MKHSPKFSNAHFADFARGMPRDQEYPWYLSSGCAMTQFFRAVYAPDVFSRFERSNGASITRRGLVIVPHALSPEAGFAAVDSRTFGELADRLAVL